ncbi:MAG: hypothetical protein KC620_01840, partial [Myxococcales bacterium]|nr:hypothetical protein [Myxococcales bacterium]
MRDAPPPPSDGKPAHPNGREDALAETREVGFRPSVTDIETPLTTMPSAPPAALRAFSDVAASAAGGSKPADLLTALRRAPSRPGGDVLPTEEPGRYTPLGPLGEGGIGCVERVFDRHLRREVALKWLKPRRRRSAIDTVESRFLDEARVTGLLEHPGIMPVYE